MRVLIALLANNIEMKTSCIKFLILLCLNILSLNLVFAQTLQTENTVSNYKYLESQIAQISEKSPLNFDQLKFMFSKNPEYNAFCYSDKDSPVSNSNEAKQLFAQFLPADLEGQVKFEYEALALGFNIFQRNEMQWIDGNSESQLNCVGGTSGCETVDMSIESPFLHLPENEDYADEVTKEESWTSYIFDMNQLYSELSLSLTVKSLDWMGRESTAVTYRQSYLCVLELKNYQTDL